MFIIVRRSQACPRDMLWASQLCRGSLWELWERLQRLLCQVWCEVRLCSCTDAVEVRRNYCAEENWLSKVVSLAIIIMVWNLTCDLQTKVYMGEECNWRKIAANYVLRMYSWILSCYSCWLIVLKIFSLWVNSVIKLFVNWCNCFNGRRTEAVQHSSALFHLSPQLLILYVCDWQAFIFYTFLMKCFTTCFLMFACTHMCFRFCVCCM